MADNPHWWNDPEKAAIAKRIAAGPAGEILAKYPLFYSKAILIGERPRRDGISHVNSATATLIRLDGGVFAVTCWHVLEAYRQCLSREPAALFQIADVSLDPVVQLAGEHQDLDLATIRLSDDQLREILREGQIGSRVIEPARWPPRLPGVGDALMFGGFPGSLRERQGLNQVVFGTFSAAGISIAAARDEEIVCQFERDYWVTSFGDLGRDPRFLRDLGGLSGGPAFVDWGIHWEFAGIVYEFSPEFDILRLRPATLIDQNGAIRVP